MLLPVVDLLLNPEQLWNSLVSRCNAGYSSAHAVDCYQIVAIDISVRSISHLSEILTKRRIVMPNSIRITYILTIWQLSESSASPKTKWSYLKA